MTDHESMVFSQRIRLPYRYTAGAAQRAALEGVAKGVMRGSRCEQCDIVLAPARPFCPRCSQATGDTVDVAHTGAVEGWTTRVRGADTVTFGMVRLDGTDTAMLHRLDLPEAELAVGVRVRARWSGAAEGEITDIDAFEAEA
jgi:uncharacterized OB-fold protein